MAEPRSIQRNAANPRDVRKAGRKERELRERILDDIREAMESPACRRWIWRILNACGTFAPVFNPATREPGSLIYYNAGQQNIGHDIVGAIDAADARMVARLRDEMLLIDHRREAGLAGEQTPSVQGETTQ